MSSNDPYRALIDRYVAAYNAFDVPGMLSVLHRDIRFRNLSNGEETASADGRDEFRDLARRGLKIFRSRRQSVREYYTEGDRAWITVDYEGVLAKDLGPGLSAGDTLRLTGRSAFTFRDGAIVELVDES